MSYSWANRKARLRALLQSKGDEEEDALALDRLLHGQSVIGRTSKTVEIDDLRFQDKDLRVMGTLDHGQFGVIDVVSSAIDGRVYIRKTTEKSIATRYREQCSPQSERDILLQAKLTDSPWVPHLYCAYQTDIHLTRVMDYAEGGNLWDVLESSPLGGRISEDDLRWWTPQIVSAIHWCHSLGFAHRDIKPHNFVLTKDARIQLVDFGTAAPLQPPDADGIRLISPDHCSVPCGTCDYISPEILKAHERALVAMELDEDSQISRIIDERDFYGLETDWWSLGAMLYEMIYGIAPFFAEDIKKTYIKIMNHQRHLRFHEDIALSSEYRDFLQRLLTDAEFRIGRHSISEITTHSVFTDVNWDDLHLKPAPQDLHLPQFTYATPDELPPQEASLRADGSSDDFSINKPIAFSGLIVSSPASTNDFPTPQNVHTSKTPDITISPPKSKHFIGFSWGPELDFSASTSLSVDENPYFSSVPTPLRVPSTRVTTPGSAPFQVTPVGPSEDGMGYKTPIRPNRNLDYMGQTPYNALPRDSAIRRTINRRSVSDREAMKQLLDCVGMSARKRVLESGREPKAPKPYTRDWQQLHGVPLSVPADDKASSDLTTKPAAKKTLRFMPPQSLPLAELAKENQRVLAVGESDAESGLETSASDITMPISPSPTPRPGSAMSVLSKRSGTPTAMYSLAGTRTFSSGSSVSIASNRSKNAHIRGSSSERLGPTAESPKSTSSNSSGSSRMPSTIHDRLRIHKERSQLMSPPLEEETFNDLETKHDYIMGDIVDIERRLRSLSNLMDKK